MRLFDSLELFPTMDGVGVSHVLHVLESHNDEWDIIKYLTAVAEFYSKK